MTQQAGRLGTARYPIGETSRNVIANIERLLKVSGLSQRGLARALYAVGRPIPAPGIAGILKGERRVDVDELVALAKVLGTTPGALVLPPASGDGPVDDILREHSRAQSVAVASAAIRVALDTLQREHDLTTIEMLGAVIHWQSSALKYMLRTERHPDERDKAADEE